MIIGKNTGSIYGMIISMRDNVNEMAAMLRDKDMLRANLRELDNKQLGLVLALVLSQIEGRSNKTLTKITQELAARVRAMEEIGIDLAQVPWPTMTIKEAR